MGWFCFAMRTVRKGKERCTMAGFFGFKEQISSLESEIHEHRACDLGIKNRYHS